MFFRNVTWIQWLCNLEDPSLTKISVDHITQASVDLKILQPHVSQLGQYAVQWNLDHDS